MAGKIKGITIEIGGNTQPLNKALADVNKKSKDLQSELRQVEKLLKLNPKDTEMLAQKQKLLAEAVENSKEKLDRLKTAQQQVNEQFKKGEISEEQYRAFQREVAKAEQELDKFEKQLNETAKATETWKDKLDKVQTSLKNVGAKMTDMGKNLSMKVTAPIAAIGAAAAKTGMDFEAAMSEVGAISGATGDDLQALEDIAKEMGATTKFSASQAAEGLKYMAMAGWDTQQMLDGLPGVLNLAAAAGEDLGLVSDIVTDAMTAFSMEAKQAGEFADTLAAASSSANTNVAMLGESFKYVAPVAGALGFTAKDTSIALSLMANAGIKGSQSGTALRTMMTNLAKPTDQMKKAMDQYGISLTDTDGNMKSLDQVMLNLRGSLGGLTEAEQAAAAATIFGKEAMSGALAIVNASEADFNKLSNAINDSAGAANRMAEEMQDNLQGRLTALKSAIEGVALQLYDAMKPALEAMVAVVQKIVDWIAKLSPEMQTAIVVIAGLAAAVGPLLIVLGFMASGLGSILAILPALGAAFAIVTGPIGIAVAAIAALTAGGLALNSYMKQSSIEVDLWGSEVSEKTQEAVGGFLKLNDEATIALNQLAWSGQAVSEEMANSIIATFDEMGNQVLTNMQEDHAQQLSEMQAFFAQSAALTDEEEAEILAGMEEHQLEEQQKVKDNQAKIQEILNQAKEEKRAITDSERAIINQIQKEMTEQAVEYMSESELEQKVIMERLKSEASKISAEQAAEVVKNSKEQKEQVVSEAEQQYNNSIAQIIKLRDEAGTITAEQADALIKEAIRQKEETIRNAEEMHARIIEEAKAQAGEHIKQVDWETGEVLNNWQVFKKDVGKTWDDIKEKSAETWGDIKEKSAETWDKIKTAIISPIESAKQTVLDIIDTIKNAFANMRIEIPSPKLPKISVDWRSVGVGNAKVSIPDFDINWYKTGGIFARPSVIGVGEAGTEAVIPLEKMPGLIADALRDAMGGGQVAMAGGITVQNMYVRNDQDIKLVARELYNLQQTNARGRGLK
jgi:TP901 family phage tail tape measure protein